MKFPKNINEYNTLVESEGLANPEDWRLNSDFSEAAALRFLFIRQAWRSIENHLDSSYTPEKIQRRRDWAEGHASRTLDPDIPLIEKFLSAGITPKEISQLVQLKQSELGANMCYIVNCLTGLSGDDDPNIGLYIEDPEGKPIERLEALDEVFYDGQPKGFDWWS